MTQALKTTIRLKKQEAMELKDMAFTLTKKAIMQGKHKVFSESELVHFAIEKVMKNIGIDENGNLKITGEEEKEKK